MQVRRSPRGRRFEFACTPIAARCLIDQHDGFGRGSPQSPPTINYPNVGHHTIMAKPRNSRVTDMSHTTNGPDLRLSHADVATLISAWEGSARDFLELCTSLTAEQWQLPTRCPAWTVGDIAAHIVAIDSELAGDPQPVHEPDWAALPNVRDDGFSRYTETFVDARRSLSQQAILVELADVIDRRTAQLIEGSHDLNAEAAGPMGRPRSVELAIRMRTFDTWVHEQDVRAAIGQPGNEGTAGAHASAHTLVAAIPFTLGKKVQAQPGISVQLVVTGAVPFDRTVEVNDAGVAGFVPTFPGEPGTADGPTVRITTDWMTFMWLGCGRVSAPQVMDDVTLEGDLALGLVYLANCTITP